MSKKPNLNDVGLELGNINNETSDNTDSVKYTIDKIIKTASKIEENPLRGERSSFVKATITLPPDMEAAIRMIGIERKISKQSNYSVSELIREAVSFWLKHQVKARI